MRPGQTIGLAANGSSLVDTDDIPGYERLKVSFKSSFKARVRTAIVNEHLSRSTEKIELAETPSPKLTIPAAVRQRGP